MFERRLKILLVVLVLATTALLGRAVQIQWVQRNYWRSAAKDMLTEVHFIGTTRGDILDRNGHKLALDVPCIDACVDYRVITEEPDPDWISRRAEDNLRASLGDDFGNVKRSKQWKDKLEQEKADVRAGILRMWADLAQEANKTPDEINEIRQGIVQGVEMRQRAIWWQSYQRAVDRQKKNESSQWYKHIFSEAGGDSTDIDNFAVDIAEQKQSYAILHALDPQQQADLARKLDQYPYLKLLPSKHREYPFGVLGCHVVGFLGQVKAEEIQSSPFADDPLSQYRDNDQIGRTGIEALCEKVLRGKRGRYEQVAGSDEIISNVDPQPGKDVRLSIDIEMEKDIVEAFARERVYKNSDGTSDTRSNQHGAAIVIDVATGKVLAMVSCPGFDPNLLDLNYAQWSSDYINLPMLNRATQVAHEPGSTVKPMGGAGAITDKIMTPTSTIQCQGVLVIDGQIQPHNHCWIYRVWEKNKDILHTSKPSHNVEPSGGPLLPNDMLTITDGLERSCNVVFETVADRMGMTNLMHWYGAFGLGRRTGVGIEEISGRLFRPDVDDRTGGMVRMLTWSAGIGEGVVQATPIQMANVAATLARGGIWMRPKLVSAQDADSPVSTGPDRVDLHLSADAVSAVQKGMYEVCNGGRWATGTGILPENQHPLLANDPLNNIHIAGKTGTAQTSPLTIPRRDASGKIVGHDIVPIGTRGTESWYKSEDGGYQHAWFIGYAPAEHPQVAFCVLVEYGEAGGLVAGSIAHDVLVACVRHGYLSSGWSQPVADMRMSH